MGTLGNKPPAGFQSIEKQTITGNGGTSYALDHAVTNVNDLEVFVNNVRQEPTTAYTLSGQNIVMSGAIANTDSFYVIYQSRSFTKAVPADTSVTTAMLQGDAVTTPKIAAKAITEAKIGGVMFGNRNMLRNASFEVNQRGLTTVTSSASSATFIRDGWLSYANGATATISINDVTLPNGVKCKSLKTVAGGTAGFLHPYQKVQTKTEYENQKFTMSAWIRTNKSGQQLRFCDSTSCFLSGESVPADGQWHYMTHTFTAGPSLNVNSPMQIQPGFASGGSGDFSTGEYLECALPQFERGEIATAFEHRSYEEELQRCYYYYYRIGKTDVNTLADYCGVAPAFATNSAWYVIIDLPTRMRTSPTVTYSAVGDFRITLQHSNTNAVTSLGIGYNDTKNPMLSIQAGSNNSGNGTRMFGYNGTYSAWLAFDAEL